MKFYTLNEKTDLFLRQYNEIYDQMSGNRKNDKLELIIVTPHKPSFRSEHEKTLWSGIYDSWININSEKENKVDAWEKIYSYGDEIIPGSKILRYKNIKEEKYFILIKAEELNEFRLLRDRLFTFNLWLHLKENRGLYHAAGIERGGKGYLFFGRSGSGKTTVSELSRSLGYNVVNDDHIVLFNSSARRFYFSNLSLSAERVELKTLFFLVQDKQDKVVLLSQADTAKKLIDGFLESMGNTILHDNLLRSAFKFSSEIARTTQGYMLYFRKSPEFWKLIDKELEG